MLWQPTGTSASPLTGDFRRALQTLIDAITLRDIDLYALTVGTGQAPCIRVGDGPPVVGRDAVIEAMRLWFADGSWSYSPTVMWTFEQDRTAFAMLEVSFAARDRRGWSPIEHQEHQLLVFQRLDDGWRLILDHRT